MLSTRTFFLPLNRGPLIVVFRVYRKLNGDSRYVLVLFRSISIQKPIVVLLH